MKTIGKALVVLLLALPPLTTVAQTAKIEKCWLEFDVKNNGKTGIRIHTKFSISGHRGKTVKAISYLYEANKRAWIDTNNQYCATDGQVCVSGEGNPKYDDTVFNDFVVFIPNDELHMAPGKHDYYFQTKIWSPHFNKFLATGDFMNFVGTGSMSNPWLLTHQDDMEVYSNYMVTHITRTPCSCVRGLCSQCGGSGRNPYDWSMPCLCMGSGKCFMCHGKSYIEYQNNFTPRNYVSSGYFKIYYDQFIMNQKNGQISGTGAVMHVYSNRVVIEAAGKNIQFDFSSISGVKEVVKDRFTYILKNNNSNDGLMFGPLEAWCPDPINGGVLFLTNEEGSDNHRGFEQKRQIFRNAYTLSF